jgi:hypothetical protein
VADVLWGRWQDDHILRRHGVSPTDFDTAWHDPNRRDLDEKRHQMHGPYYVSVGWARLGKPLKMVWRWQGSAVWPITAFFPGPTRPSRARRRKRRGK